MRAPDPPLHPPSLPSPIPVPEGNRPLPARADVVIVGAGLLGLFLALELRTQGGGEVVVVEGGRVGAGSTLRSAGGVRRLFASSYEVELSLATLPLLEALFTDRSEGGPSFEGAFDRAGYVVLAGDRDAKLLEEVARIAADRGTEYEWIGASSLPEHFWWIDPTGLVAALRSPEDGFLDPRLLLERLVHAARSAGVQIAEGRPVNAFEMRSGSVRGLRAGSERIDVERVVIAAGAWSAEVTELAGVKLPVRPSPRFKYWSDPDPAIPERSPLVTDLSTGAYLRCRGSRAFVGVRPTRPRIGTSLDPSPGAIAELRRRASARFPGLAHLPPREVVAGLYELTPDGLPLAGPLPEAPGLHVVAGFNGHGIMHGPGVARAVAESLLLGRSRSLDLDPLRPDRFESSTPYRPGPVLI